MQFFKDVKKYKNYIKYATRSDLEAEVTNAYLHWIWWILEPVCNMLIYYFIFGYVFKNDEQYYLVFIYSAITMWNFFNKILNISVELVRNSRSIISKIYVPKTVILLQKMRVCAFKMLISVGIVIILMIPYRVSVDWHLILLIPDVLSFVLFTYGVSCIFMHYGVFVEDLSYVISIVLRMLTYFTGIFYSVATKIPAPYGEILETANPLAFYIASMRNALMYKSGYSFKIWLFWTFIAFALSVIGTRLVYKNENNYVKVI